MFWIGMIPRMDKVIRYLIERFVQGFGWTHRSETQPRTDPWHRHRGMGTSLLGTGIREPRTDLRNRGDHHPREKLHGGDILVVESVRRGGEHFEYSERTVEMAKRRDQDGTHPQVATGGHIDPWIRFSVRANQNFTGAYTFGRQSTVGLQPTTDVGRGTPGTSAAHHVVSPAKGNRRSGRARQRLRFFGDDADAGLEIEWAGTTERRRVRPGEPTVRLIGLPGELLLYVFGRQHAAQVEVTGPAEAVAAVHRAHFGM